MGREQFLLLSCMVSINGERCESGCRRMCGCVYVIIFFRIVPSVSIGMTREEIEKKEKEGKNGSNGSISKGTWSLVGCTYPLFFLFPNEDFLGFLALERTYFYFYSLCIVILLITHSTRVAVSCFLGVRVPSTNTSSLE